MKFDKSKVCVAGLHEVPVGTKGYFSDEICNLRDYVKDEDKDMYGTKIKEPQDDWYTIIKENGYIHCCHFFYPCEEQVKQYRPYKTIEEALTLKGKWLKHKSWDCFFEVTKIEMLNGSAIINNIEPSFLYEMYTMEDGTPIGIPV